MARHQDAVAAVMKMEPNGWWLPEDDSYFARYVAGPPPKRNGFYREHLQEALKFVRGWDVAIDVGAHVGFWAWDMAQRFKAVYAFEPCKTTYECLLRNIEEFDNVRGYNLAVGDSAGVCEIRNDKQRPGNTGSNYIIPGDGEVTLVALDEMDLPGCDFLKVDVEGFELRALQGAAHLISDCHPVISMECTDFKFKDRYGIPEGSAERWLLKRGYQVVWQDRPDKVFAWST